MSGPQAGSLGLWWVLGAGFVVGLVTVAAGHLRIGGLVIAGALALAGVLRLVLPDSALGALVVRRRTVDVLAMWGLALALALVLTNVDLRPR